MYTNAFNDGEWFDEDGEGWWRGVLESMESEYGESSARPFTRPLAPCLSLSLPVTRCDERRFEMNRHQPGDIMRRSLYHHRPRYTSTRYTSTRYTRHQYTLRQCTLRQYTQRHYMLHHYTLHHYTLHCSTPSRTIPPPVAPMQVVRGSCSRKMTHHYASTFVT